jgi:hypothetical protein
MYTGYWVQLMRDIPYAAVQFVSYEAMNRRINVVHPVRIPLSTDNI